MNEDNNDLYSNIYSHYSRPAAGGSDNAADSAGTTPPAYSAPYTPTPEPSAPDYAARRTYAERPYTPPVTETPRREKKSGGKRAVGVAALCLSCSILAAAVSAGVTSKIVKDSIPAYPVTTSVATAPLVSSLSYEADESGLTAADLYDLATKQVVGVSTEISYRNIFGQVSAASVTGSGVIISEDGYIITNYHVIEDAYEGGYQVEVMLYDETEYDAEIVGFDADNDIALLKIDAAGLSAAQLGDSDELVVGERVYAVGNPLGELSYTMTSGIVSATNRSITTESNVAVTMFQIDAAVNSGNSGGPVYNAAGQVVGIVTAKYSSTGVEGIGFAIPISDAAHIVNQILEYGYVADRAYMGITCATVTSAAASSYNMVEGAYVNTVTEDSAAEKAGLEVGDIITALDGEAVAGSSELTSMLLQYHAGDEAELTVWRDGETVTLTIVFDQKPEETPEAAAPSASDEPQTYGGRSGGGQYGYYNGDIEDFFRQFFGY